MLILYRRRLRDFFRKTYWVIDINLDMLAGPYKTKTAALDYIKAVEES